MKKTIIQVARLSLVAAMLALIPAASQAQGTNSAATNPAIVSPAVRPLPFHGLATAVDTSAMTITVGNHVYTITPKTRIGKVNHAANLSDITVGDFIGGSYKKTADGKLEAIMIRVLPRPPQNKVKAGDSAAPGAPATPAMPGTTH